MPAFEIYVDTETYGGTTGNEPDVIKAKDAYAAAVAFAGRYAPCTIRRERPEEHGDVFQINAMGATSGGVFVHVWEHEERV